MWYERFFWCLVCQMLKILVMFGLASAFSFFFFFFFFHAFSPPQAITVHVRYMNSIRNFWPVFCEQCIRVLFMDPQISFFIKFFIKNGSYDTSYTFKNYFVTVISAISFQCQQNKSYPNRPLVFGISDTNAQIINKFN